MIAVDTSALMAIVLDEPEADACIAALEAADDILISAGTVAEALIVSARRDVSREMTKIIDELGLEIVSVIIQSIEDMYNSGQVLLHSFSEVNYSFFSSLHSLLSPFSSASTPPPVSPVLVSHFPYLSLYTPFITSFNTTVTALTNMLSPSSPSYNQPFASFITAQETDPRCRKLKLRDWFLTIVQRCPRYLLLLKDLLQCTDPEDTEYEQLTAVHTLVSKSISIHLYSFSTRDS